MSLITGPVFSETVIKLKANTTNPYGGDDVTIKGIIGVSSAGDLGKSGRSTCSERHRASLEFQVQLGLENEPWRMEFVLAELVQRIRPMGRSARVSRCADR